MTTNVFSIPCINSYPKGFFQSMINWVKEMKQSQSGRLACDLKLKMGARVMLVINIDIDNRLINGQLGSVVRTKFRNGRVEIDHKAGLKAPAKYKCDTLILFLLNELRQFFQQLGGKKLHHL